MKSTRHTSRSQVLQVLYQLDSQELTVQTGLEYFRLNFDTHGAETSFVERLIAGVVENVKAVDEIINGAATGWRVDRMARVDRNILRLGVFEILYCDDIPAAVTINEMIELSKSFGEVDTPKFVNAVLDSVRLKHPQPNKVP